jgi:hypothetical protein
MPEPCLARNQAQNGYFVKRLIAFISNVYGGQILPVEVRGPSSIRPNAHAMMMEQTVLQSCVSLGKTPGRIMF